MSSGSWTNSDGLYIQFGTTKAVPETGGDYKMPGPNRFIEVDINLANLTSSTLSASSSTSAPTVISNTLFFPEGQGTFIEKVELLNVTPGSTTAIALSLGLVQGDRVTVPTTGGATSFINAFSLTGATISAQGSLVTFTVGSSGAGALIGSSSVQWNTNTTLQSNSVGGYLTANLGTITTATGTYRARIFYHGVGTIQY